MTPKRFKAVRKSDGQESFSNFDLMDAIIWSNHCAGSIDVDGFFSFDLNSTPDLDDVAICQSTGLTDSRGWEVYEGACLWWPSMRPGVWVIVEHLNGEYRGRLNDSGVWIQFTLKEMLEKGMVAIGNRWMPQEELEARAEKLTQP